MTSAVSTALPVRGTKRSVGSWRVASKSAGAMVYCQITPCMPSRAFLSNSRSDSTSTFLPPAGRPEPSSLVFQLVM
jgi:hypothetical protein